LDILSMGCLLFQLKHFRVMKPGYWFPRLTVTLGKSEWNAFRDGPA